MSQPAQDPMFWQSVFATSLMLSGALEDPLLQVLAHKTQDAFTTCACPLVQDPHIQLIPLDP